MKLSVCMFVCSKVVRESSTNWRVVGSTPGEALLVFLLFPCTKKLKLYSHCSSLSSCINGT